MSNFKWTSSGALQHFINDELRATIPGDYVPDYLAAIGASPDDLPKE